MRPLLILSLLLVVVLEGCNDNRTVIVNREAATTPSPASISSSAGVVKVRTEPVTIPAGGKSNATVTLSISSGFHVNANPVTFPYLIPTEVTAENSEEITVDKAVYTAGRMEK